MPIKDKFAAILLCIMATIMCACSNNDVISEEEPETVLANVNGTWLEYAYLCSDGYFVDISDTDYNMYYDFAMPNIFTQYTIDKDGNKNIEKKGEWTYNPQTRIAHITEPRGWNLDITFSFGNDETGAYTAIMDIKGRTPTSSATIKAKRIQ